MKHICQCILLRNVKCSAIEMVMLSSIRNRRRFDWKRPKILHTANIVHIAWLWSFSRCCNSIISLLPGDHTEITSPNYGPGQEYPKNTECTWHIVSSASEKLAVTFHTFDIEFHVSCVWDYVEITDGGCAAGSGQTLCGSSLPQPYVTSGTSLCIRFHSDIIITKDGFNLTVSASALKPSSSTSSTTTSTMMTSSAPHMTSELPHIACQGDISVISHSATISSPGFGVNSTYPNNAVCVWVIELQEKQTATVSFESFALESHPFCGYDWLKVFDGPHFTSSVKKTFCGYSVPASFTLSKSTCLKFRSDVIVPKAGFMARILIKSQSSFVSPTSTVLSSLSTSTAFATITNALEKITSFSSSYSSSISSTHPPSTLSSSTHPPSTLSSTHPPSTLSSSTHPPSSLSSTHPPSTLSSSTHPPASSSSTHPPSTLSSSTHPPASSSTHPSSTSSSSTHPPPSSSSSSSTHPSSTLSSSTHPPSSLSTTHPPSSLSSSTHPPSTLSSTHPPPSSSSSSTHPLVLSSPHPPSSSSSSTTTTHPSTISSSYPSSSSSSSSSSSHPPSSPSSSPSTTTTQPLSSLSSSHPPTLSSTQTSSLSLSSSSQTPSSTHVSYVEMCKEVDDVDVVNTTMLLSPDYQQGVYPISTSCDITVQAELGQRLFVTFLVFDFELHPTCNWDSLTLYDGSCSTGKSMGKFCGSSLIQNFTTTQSKLCVKFVSDFIVSKQGFKAVIQIFQGLSTNNVTLPPDETTVDVSSESPVTPLNPVDVKSTSTPSGTSLNAPASTAVATANQSTTVSDSSTLPFSSTSSTSTTIYSSSSVLSSIPSTLSSVLSLSTSTKTSPTEAQTSALLTYLFQNLTSSPTQSPGSVSPTTQNQTVLSSSTASGTAATTTSISSEKQIVSLCSLGSVSVYNQIVITSPNFGPGLLYPLKTTCTLCVSSAKSKKLHMRFTDFDIEFHPSCSWDSLTVFDGSSTAAPVLATLCGGLYQVGNITSTSTSLCLKFVSDFMAPRHGFRAVVEPASYPAKTTTATTPSDTVVTSASTTGSTSSTIITNPTDTASEGEITDPSTRTSVTTSTETTVPLVFTSAASTASSSLTTSHMTINISTGSASKTNPTSKTAATTLASATISASSITTHTAAKVNTSTTSESSKTSSAAFTTIPTTITTNTGLKTSCSGVPQTLKSDSGTITSPGFPTVYPNNLDCQWIIDAPKYMIIHISFTSFELEFHGKCDWDSLTIYQGSDVTDDVIVKLCGDNIPNNITTFGGKVLLYLHTDRMKGMTGFNLTYHTAQSSATTTVSPPVTCPSGRAPCNNGTCIPADWLCDGEHDCLEGEDELSCGHCTDKEFQCGNGSCLPSHQRCDGHGQCMDQEDEDNCVMLDSNNGDGTLLVMRSGTWFPVCFDQWEAGFSDAACSAADYGSSVYGNSTTSSSTFFLIPVQDLTGSQNRFHTKFKLKSSCPGGEVVSLSCQPRECGLKSKNLPSAYILGGSRSVRGEWPWVVSLMSGTKMVCGASIISERWLVTASHCVEAMINSPQTTFIVAGTVNLKSPDVEYLRVTEMILHPDHNFIYNADIALIHLQRPLQFSNRVKPLCLPTRQRKWATSLPCYIAGWGVTLRQHILPGVTSSYLHHAKLKLWQQKKCRDTYETKVKDTMICAGHQYGEVDACKGDSGGPLMCRTGRDKWELVGVTSWGEGCGLIGKPGVYTRIDHYITWIQEQTTHTTEVDCDFESPGMCGYQDTSKNDYIWTRRKGGTYIPERPFTDSTYGTKEGHYMYAFISYEAKNQIATLDSPTFFNSGFSCLTFYTTFVNAKDAKLRVYGTSNSSDDLILLTQLSPIQGDWRLVEHELSGDVRRVVFVAEAGRYTEGGVGIDDVIIEDRRCEGFMKVNCDFDSGTLCEYLQAQDDTFDWNLKPVELRDDDSRGPLGHSTDHYIEADLSSRNPGDKTRVLSPVLNSTVPQCISFRFKIQPAHSGTLSVCTESEFDGEVFLGCSMWSRANSVDNDWTDGQAQIPASSYPYRVGFQAETGTFSGVIAIDNLSKKDGVCQL